MKWVTKDLVEESDGQFWSECLRREQPKSQECRYQERTGKSANNHTATFSYEC
jgi:hypothetical protein